MFQFHSPNHFNRRLHTHTQAKPRTLSVATLIALLGLAAVFGGSGHCQSILLEPEVSPNPVRPGERLTLEFTASNPGDNFLTGVVVEVDVPEHLVPITGHAFLGGDCPGTYCEAGEILRWTVGDLPPRQSRRFSFSGEVESGASAPPNGTVIEFNTRVLATGDLSVSHARGTRVVQNRGLVVSLDDSRDPIPPGGILEYSITYGNESNQAIQGVELHLALPEGVDFDSAEEGGQFEEGVVSWTIGALPPGGSGARRVKVHAAGDPGSLLYTEAWIEGEGDAESRSGEVTAVRTDSPVVFQIVASPDPIRPGERIVVELTASNIGDVELSGVGVRAQTPNGIVPTGLLPFVGGNCPGTYCESGEFIVWNFPALPPKKSRTVNFSAPILSGAEAPPNGSLIVCRGWVNHSGQVGAHNSHSRTVLVENAPTARLSVEENRDPVEPGAMLVYTLNYSNPSAAAAPDALLSFTLPEGVDFVSADQGGSLANEVVEWELGDLSPGEFGQRKVELEVTATNGDVIEGGAALIVPSDATPLARAGFVTGVQQENPLILRLTAGPDPIRPGERLSGEVVVSNNGFAALDGVSVRLRVPEHIVPTQFFNSPGGSCPGTYCESGEFATWTLGLLPPGESRTVAFSAEVASGAQAPSDGTQIVVGVEAFEASGFQSGQSRTVMVRNNPTLRLLVDEDRDPAESGGDLIYTLTYSNPSQSTAPRAGLRFDIPEGAEFVTADRGGIYNGESVIWPLGDLSPGEIGQRKATVVVLTDEGGLIVGNGEAFDQADPRGIARGSSVATVWSDNPLKIRMTAHPDPVRPGNRLAFEATVSNRGLVELDAVRVRIQTPTHLASAQALGLLPSVGGNCPGTYCDAGEFISWTVGALPPGQSRTVGFSSPVSSGAQAPANGTLIQGRAWADHGGSNGASAAQTRSVWVKTPTALQVFLDEDSDPVVSGEFLTYTLTLGNPSTSSVPDALLRFRIPEGTMFADADEGALLRGGSVVWRWGALPPGKILTRTVTVAVTADPGEAILAEVEAFGGGDPRDVARTGAVTHVIDSQSPIGLSLAAGPDPILPGEPLVIHLSLENLGNVELAGTAARLRVPEFISQTGMTRSTGGSCPGTYCESGEFVTWTVGALGVGESRILSATVPVSSGANAPADGTLIHLYAEGSGTGIQPFASASATIKIGTFTADIAPRYNPDLCPPPLGDGRLDACDLLMLMRQMADGDASTEVLFEASYDWMVEDLFGP